MIFLLLRYVVAVITKYKYRIKFRILLLVLLLITNKYTWGRVRQKPGRCSKLPPEALLICSAFSPSDARICACLQPSATLMAASRVPSDSSTVALFLRSASTCTGAESRT